MKRKNEIDKNKKQQHYINSQTYNIDNEIKLKLLYIHK